MPTVNDLRAAIKADAVIYARPYDFDVRYGGWRLLIQRRKYNKRWIAHLSTERWMDAGARNGDANRLYATPVDAAADLLTRAVDAGLEPPVELMQATLDYCARYG